MKANTQTKGIDCTLNGVRSAVSTGYIFPTMHSPSSTSIDD